MEGAGEWREWGVMDMESKRERELSC